MQSWNNTDLFSKSLTDCLEGMTILIRSSTIGGSLVCTIKEACIIRGAGLPALYEQYTIVLRDTNSRKHLISFTYPGSDYHTREKCIEQVIVDVLENNLIFLKTPLSKVLFENGQK